MIEIVVSERGVGHSERKFLGKGSSTNDCWRQNTRVPWLSRGVACVILLFRRFDTIPACDRQTHRHTTAANTRASLAPRR